MVYRKIFLIGLIAFILVLAVVLSLTNAGIPKGSLTTNKNGQNKRETAPIKTIFGGIMILGGTILLSSTSKESTVLLREWRASLSWPKSKVEYVDY